MKFKVWDSEEKDWVDRNLFLISGDGSFLKYNENGRPVFADERYVKVFSTEIKDKNGVEIYEGDIVKQKDCWWGNGVVNLVKCDKEINGDMQWIAGDSYNLWEQDEIEIIGNKFENPELLEPKK